MGLMDRVKAMWSEEVRRKAELKRLEEARMVSRKWDEYADVLARQQYIYGQMDRSHLLNQGLSPSIQPLPGLSQDAINFRDIIGTYTFGGGGTPPTRRLTGLSQPSYPGLGLLEVAQSGVLCQHSVRVEERPFTQSYDVVHTDGDRTSVYTIDALLLREVSYAAIDSLYDNFLYWLRRIHTEAEQALLDAGAYDYYDNIEPETLI